MTKKDSNGTREAIDTLKQQVRNLFERVGLIERNGCPHRTDDKERITKIEVEIKDMSDFYLNLTEQINNRFSRSDRMIVGVLVALVVNLGVLLFKKFIP